MTTVRVPAHLRSTNYVKGLTHALYRYPAAAPPELVREVIATYTHPGDLVLDPFMGGGTTIVEALAQGRRAVGFDANSLAVFVTRAKTTPLRASDWHCLGDWLTSRPLRYPVLGEADHDERAGSLPPPLRRRIASGLASLHTIQHSATNRLARCCLLRLGQWALETQFGDGQSHRDYVPHVRHLEEKLAHIVEAAKVGMDDLVMQARAHRVHKSRLTAMRRLGLRSVWQDLTPIHLGDSAGRIRLVLTSPPYPGVHVLYHRWQVQSRRETAAPYWISGTADGLAASYYTMGSRSPLGQRNYFERLTIGFARLRPALTSDGVVVQLVAFNNPEVQLPFFLDAMEQAGFELAVPIPTLDADLSRQVPNRRWYVRGRPSASSRELLLVHRPRPSSTTAMPPLPRYHGTGSE